MVRCSVLGCKSDSERKVPDLSFHTFPTNDNIRMLWIEATGRKHWTPKVASRICSTHFEKKMVIKKKKTTFLIHDAVPLIVSKNSTRLHILKPMEINDKSSIIASNLTPHNSLVTESDDTLSAISDDPESPQLNGSSLVKLTFYAQQRMQQKLKNALKQSSNRLKKLRALREKYRRLTKKVVKLENVIAEIKSKCPVSKTLLGSVTEEIISYIGTNEQMAVLMIKVSSRNDINKFRTYNEEIEEMEGKETRI